MPRFRKAKWLGNNWASIEIIPDGEIYFLPIFHYLITTYNIPKPQIIPDMDGFIVEEFKLLNSRVLMGIDTWEFSIAFEKDTVRDTVFDALTQLPSDYFDS